MSTFLDLENNLSTAQMFHMFQVHRNTSRELSIVLELQGTKLVSILHEEVLVSVVSIIVVSTIVVSYRPSLVKTDLTASYSWWTIEVAKK